MLVDFGHGLYCKFKCEPLNNANGVVELYPTLRTPRRSNPNVSASDSNSNFATAPPTKDGVYLHPNLYTKLFSQLSEKKGTAQPQSNDIPSIENSKPSTVFVFVQLLNIQEHPNLEPLSSIPFTSLKPSLNASSATSINHTPLHRSVDQTPYSILLPAREWAGITSLNLEETECFIPSSSLRNHFLPQLSTSPFILSSTKSQLQLSDWRMLIWLADDEVLHLKEVVLEVNYSLKESQQQQNVDEEPTWNWIKEAVVNHFQSKAQRVRQGEDFSLSINNHYTDTIYIRCLYSEPTLQGLIGEATQLILVQATEAIDQVGQDSITGIPLTSSPSPSLSINTPMSPGNFNPLQFLSGPRRHNRSTSSGASSPKVLSRKNSGNKLNLNQPNGVKALEYQDTIDQLPLFDTHPWSVRTGLVFKITLLTHHNMWRQLLPSFLESEIDPHSAILVPLRALSNLKLVSGDWVISKIIYSGSDEEQSSSKPPRWCQIFGVGHRQLSKLGLMNVLGRDFALIDPVLNFNLGVKEDSLLAVQKVAEAERPGVATSVTLARVASPIANQKLLQAPIATALRNYMNRTWRSLCVGDILPVIIDESTAHFNAKPSDDSVDISILSLGSSEAHVMSYFKVTDIAAIPEHYTSSELDIKALVQSGLFVDPKSTKTVQQGLEHTMVPGSMRKFHQLSPSNYAPDESYEKMKSLIQSCLHPSASELDVRCSILLYGPRGVGKSQMVKEAADQIGLHFLEVHCYDWVEESDLKTQENFEEWFNKIPSYSPCLVLLKHLDALAKKFAPSDVQQEPWLSTMFFNLMNNLSERTVIVVGTAESVEKFPPGLLTSFRHEIKIEVPSEQERLSSLQSLTSKVNLAPDVSVKSLATETAALVVNDLLDLVERASGLAFGRLNKESNLTNQSATSLAHSGIAIQGADFESALNQARSQYSDSIGAPKIPSVTWDDVGGLASVKSDILDTIQLPLQHPELFTSGAKQRSGILLYGPPGTGKTLLAKAVATSCALNFFSVKGPELLNMYIGESEANVRRVFQRARDAKPCVIFFDELDSVAPKRGEQGDSGGVMDRIVSQLLAELDGMGDASSSGGGQVFVIGATNRPDLLDPALLRPGRFDKMLYLGVSQDHAAQCNILEALTRKFRLAPDLVLQDVANQCPFHYTGADFYALCSDAMLKAMSRTANSIEQKVIDINKQQLAQGETNKMTVGFYMDHKATKEELEVLVKLEDFELALKELTPSVTPSELSHYNEIRLKFASQTLNAPPDATPMIKSNNINTTKTSPQQLTLQQTKPINNMLNLSTGPGMSMPSTLPPESDPASNSGPLNAPQHSFESEEKLDNEDEGLYN